MKKFATKFHLNLRLALRTNFTSRCAPAQLRVSPSFAWIQFVQSTPFFVRLFDFAVRNLPNKASQLGEVSLPEGKDGGVFWRFSNSLSLAYARQSSTRGASEACSTLWLKICHWHIFLTRRALSKEPQ